MVLYFGCSKIRFIETAILSLIFLAFKDISFTVESLIMMEEVSYTDIIFASQQ